MYIYSFVRHINLYANTMPVSKFSIRKWHAVALYIFRNLNLSYFMAWNTFWWDWQLWLILAFLILSHQVTFARHLHLYLLWPCVYVYFIAECFCPLIKKNKKMTFKSNEWCIGRQVFLTWPLTRDKLISQWTKMAPTLQSMHNGAFSKYKRAKYLSFIPNIIIGRAPS